MEILSRRTFLAATGAAATLPYIAHAAVSDAQVFTADPMGALVDSTVILGDTNAVLIDAQINVANADRLVALIRATGKNLETVFITHAHPDHYLGLARIADAFPAARILTPAPIRPLIEAAGQGTLDYLRTTAPEGTFADRVVIPDALDADHIMLDGERIDILPPMHGDTGLVSAVHIPVLNTLIATDFAYADTHAWMAENQTPDLIDQWRASLTQLEAIGAATVIPGHRQDSSTNDATVFAKTRAYLDQWQTARAEAKDADDLRARMMAGNEALGLTFALDMAIAAAFPAN
jgi:glyoxylase-like metal-dependent hydrolase (beta-lactamase superfamily II)